MPVPEPTPVAINDTPAILLLAPIAVQSVVPTFAIRYLLPTLMLVANVKPLVGRQNFIILSFY